MNLDDFTHARYREILRAGLAAGYCFASFDEIAALRRDGRRGCLLRHDCDNDLVAAAQIAAIEAEEGVSSTYFVMLRSAMYNLLAPTNRALVARILGAGHRLGLHFDDSVVAGESEQRIVEFVDQERRFLFEEFGQEISVVSFHQPGRRILKNLVKLSCLNTYDRNDMAGIHYTSDSNLNFRGGEPAALFLQGAHRIIQILLHPEWWTSEAVPLDTKWDQMLLNNIQLMQENLLKREETFTALRGIYIYEQDGNE